jgi:hypothetical protein
VRPFSLRIIPASAGNTAARKTPPLHPFARDLSGRCSRAFSFRIIPASAGNTAARKTPALRVERNEHHRSAQPTQTSTETATEMLHGSLTRLPRSSSLPFSGTIGSRPAAMRKATCRTPWRCGHQQANARGSLEDGLRAGLRSKSRANAKSPMACASAEHTKDQCIRRYAFPVGIVPEPASSTSHSPAPSRLALGPPRIARRSYVAAATICPTA